jgi:hypothetical protein
MNHCCASHLKCRVVGAVGPRLGKPSAACDTRGAYVDTAKRAARAAFCCKFGAAVPFLATKGPLTVDYTSVERMALPAYRALHLAVLGGVPTPESTLEQIERSVRAALSEGAAMRTRASSVEGTMAKTTGTTKSMKTTKTTKTTKTAKFVLQLQTDPFELVAFLSLLSHFSLTIKYATSNIETSQTLSHTQDQRPKKGTFQLVLGDRAGNYLLPILREDLFCLKTVAALKLLVWWVQEQIGFTVTKQKSQNFQTARQQLATFVPPMEDKLYSEETTAQWWSRCTSLSLPPGIKVLAAGGVIPPITGKAHPVILTPQAAREGVRRIYLLILKFFGVLSEAPAHQKRADTIAQIAQIAAADALRRQPLKKCQAKTEKKKEKKKMMTKKKVNKKKKKKEGELPVEMGMTVRVAGTDVAAAAAGTNVVVAATDPRMDVGAAAAQLVTGQQLRSENDARRFAVLRVPSYELLDFGMDRESLRASSGRFDSSQDASWEATMMGAPGPAVQLQVAPRGERMSSLSLLEPSPLRTPQNILVAVTQLAAESAAESAVASAGLDENRNLQIEGVVWAEISNNERDHNHHRAISCRKRRGTPSERSGLTPRAKRHVLDEASPRNSLGLCEIPYEMAKAAYRF